MIQTRQVVLSWSCSSYPDPTWYRAAQDAWQPPCFLVCLPPIHPSILSTLPLFCTQPRDLICLVILELACSAQFHFKVKLDKGIGDSPCKTTSPWQLLEWARQRVEEGRRLEVGRVKDVPERKVDNNSLSSFPLGGFVSGWKPATKTETV